MRQLALIGLLLAAVALPAAGQDEPAPAPICQNDSKTECGWWWSLHPEPEPEPEERLPSPRPQPQAPEKKPAPKKVDCTDPGQWVAPCGFKDPKGSFDFQAKQRDALRQRMVMNPNDPKAVRGFQEYSNWMLNQAIAVSRMWRFNSTQDPSLNPAVDKPVSRFGLKLLEREKKKGTEAIYDLIREEDGFFVWFTRSDCPYCHDMLPLIMKLQEKTGIEVHNASLDEQCMSPFPSSHCLTGKDSRVPAAKLAVRTVPDLMIYLPKDNTWIRLATGVVTLSTIEIRIKLFVGAMQAAYENAVVNSETEHGPNVDFLDDAKIQQNLGMGRGIDPED